MIDKNDLPQPLGKLVDMVEEQWQNKKYWNAKFDRFSRIGAKISGRPLAFNIALALVASWLITGPCHSRFGGNGRGRA